MAGRIVLQTIGDNLKTINQTSHGFSLGDIVRVQGTGTYVLAQADTDINAEVIGIVVEIIDTDNFTLQTDGFINDSAIVPNEPAGTVFFLSPTTAGDVTKDDSTFVATNINKPVFVVTIPNSEALVLTYRGIEIAAPLTEFARHPLVTIDATTVVTKTITVANDIINDTETVTINGQIVYKGASEAYTIVNDTDVVFNADVPLIIGDKIRIDYSYI